MATQLAISLREGCPHLPRLRQLRQGVPVPYGQSGPYQPVRAYERLLRLLGGARVPPRLPTNSKLLKKLRAAQLDQHRHHKQRFLDGMRTSVELLFEADNTRASTSNIDPDSEPWISDYPSWGPLRSASFFIVDSLTKKEKRHQRGDSEELSCDQALQLRHYRKYMRDCFFESLHLKKHDWLEAKTERDALLAFYDALGMHPQFRNIDPSLFVYKSKEQPAKRKGKERARPSPRLAETSRSSTMSMLAARHNPGSAVSTTAMFSKVARQFAAG